MFFRSNGLRKISALGFASATTIVACAGSAQAGSVNLIDGLGNNSGWKATWDNSLDPFVSINTDAVNFGSDFVVIEKVIQYTLPPINGVFQSVAIVFEQVNANAVHNIVINDEIITNSTGSAWNGFQMDVLNHGEVLFNPTASAGFSTAPFGSSAFSNGNSRFIASGGNIPNGGVWFPGAASGELWINVANLTGSTLFVLKETPLPAPGAIALLGVAALAGSRRRRH